MNKKGDFFGLFVMVIFSLVIVVTAGIFIYIQDTTEDKLKQTIGNRSFNNGKNGTEIIDNTFAGVGTAYNSLPWLSAFLIIGMIIAILVGSYLVTTKPVMFIPFIFLLIILIMLGAGISNAYETLIANPTLSSSYDRFSAANYFLLHLPETLTIIGFIGAIVMFSRLGRRQQSDF